MKLASVGIDPDPVGFPAGHVSIHDPIELLEVSCYWQFYYVTLEMKLQVFFNSPTLKMKLASVGIDPDYIGFPADHVSAELFDLLHFYSYLKQNHRFL